MKIRLWAVYILLFALIFTGCKEKKVDSQKTVILNVHYYKQENVTGLQNVFEEFKKRNPGIEVELSASPNDENNTMNILADAGEFPDII